MDASVREGTSCMTIQGWPLSSNTSYTAATPGWLSRPAALASRNVRVVNISRSGPVSPLMQCSSLTATSRPRSSSTARQTTPMPPRPSDSTSR